MQPAHFDWLASCDSCPQRDVRSLIHMAVLQRLYEGGRFQTFAGGEWRKPWKRKQRWNTRGTDALLCLQWQCLCDSASNFIVANIFSRHVLINTCYYRHQILWITDRRGSADNLSFAKAILAFFLTHPETMSHDSRSLLRSYTKPWTFTKFRAVLSCKEWIWGRTLKATWELHFWLTKKVLKKKNLFLCQFHTILFTTYQCQKVSWKSRCVQVLVHSLLVLMHWVAWAVSWRSIHNTVCCRCCSF